MKSPWNKGLTKETDKRVAKYGRLGSITKKHLFKEGKLISPFKDKHHTKEAKKKMSLKHKGKGVSIKTEFKKGHISWNNGLTKEKDKRLAKSGAKHSITMRKLYKEGKLKSWNKGRPYLQIRGKNHPIFGKHWNKKTKQKISQSQKKYYKTHNVWNKNKTTKEDNRILNNKNHPNWKGGVSFEPYGQEFNDDLKLIIRFRDAFTCQLCKMKENGQALDIHHINFNKKDSFWNNLIALCHNCHLKTNFNRKYWINYFGGIMK